MMGVVYTTASLALTPLTYDPFKVGPSLFVTFLLPLSKPDIDCIIMIHIGHFKWHKLYSNNVYREIARPLH